MKRILCAVAFFLFFAKPVGAATTVNTFTPGASSVGIFKKFEASFTISRSFPGLPASDNPPVSDIPAAFLPYYYYSASEGGYAADGITIDAYITAPSGKQIVQPAFYYQDYIYTPPQSMTATQNYSWKIRFAPQELGNYSYYLRIEDKYGISRYPSSGTLTFTSVASSSKGFVRVSGVDPRFMQFDNGESFIPIASGHQWWKCCGLRVSDYINSFATFKANGINLTRVWDQNDGYGLTVEGHFDSYSYPNDYNPVDTGQINTIRQGTQMNQRSNYEEDKLIEAAENNGVYLQLCAHGDPYWIWNGSTYPPTDGTGTAFDDLKHINNWKRNFRYRVARWGYSTSILAWEAWNEHGQDMFRYPGVVPFYQALGDYQKQTDPYHHLRTTSQGSQNYSAGFWSLPQMDIANYHDYMRPTYPDNLTNDEVHFVQSFAWCLGRNRCRRWFLEQCCGQSAKWRSQNQNAS
jgi:hypothetical protein